MRIHCIIHAAFENPGIIKTWARENDHSFFETHTYNNEKLPGIDAFDFLIIMGGPQSPLHLEKWPYLQDEIHLIKQSIDTHKAVLGICLGAQLIAESLGAKTEKSPHREIGVFPIELLSDAATDPIFSQFPHIFPAMHWHNDMPGLPTGARLLAKSMGCPRQAFSIGDRIYGLQCHLEMTHESIVDMLTHCDKELTPDLYVESRKTLLRRNMIDINDKMLTLLDYLSSMTIPYTPHRETENEAHN